jgi:integrase
LFEGKAIMNVNHRTDYLDEVTRTSDGVLSRLTRESRQADSKREDNGFHPVIQNATMTFSSFVETKFIPEHVQHKTLAGRTHYQAMLKHLIRPETVHRMFNPRNVSNARLHADPDWPYLDQVRLCDLKAEHVRRLVAAAFAHDYSWQTVKHIKNVAFAIIAHAQQEGCFHGLNPVSQVKLPPKIHRPTPNLSINETRAILQLLPCPEKHVALFTLSTGMNIPEICNLQWKHVNLTESPRVLDQVLIPPYSIAVRTQWNRTGLGSERQSRNRNIALPVSLFAVLADWALEKTSLSPEGFVLVSDTGLPISPADLRSSRLVPTGRKLGLPWLSWRVLCRAHAILLSEFRPQLDYMIGNAGLNGLTVSAQRDQSDISVLTHKSDTMSLSSLTPFLSRQPDPDGKVDQ